MEKKRNNRHTDTDTESWRIKWNGLSNGEVIAALDAQHVYYIQINRQVELNTENQGDRVIIYIYVNKEAGLANLGRCGLCRGAVLRP